MIATDSSYCNNPFEAVVIDLPLNSLVCNMAYLVKESILSAEPILKIRGKEDFSFSTIIARRDIEKLNTIGIFKPFWKVWITVGIYSFHVSHALHVTYARRVYVAILH